MKNGTEKEEAIVDDDEKKELNKYLKEKKIHVDKQFDQMKCGVDMDHCSIAM